MATHEQTYLGPVIEVLEAEGYITLSEDENSYGIAARFCELAAENGVLIDASDACDDCLQSIPGVDPAKLARARAVNLRLFGFDHAVAAASEPRVSRLGRRPKRRRPSPGA